MILGQIILHCMLLGVLGDMLSSPCDLFMFIFILYFQWFHLLEKGNSCACFYILNIPASLASVIVTGVIIEQLYRWAIHEFR